jgi:tetratricopeptide (TPR) repeat protein
VKGALAAGLLLGLVALSAPERWLHNPRERTARAVEAWQGGDFAAAQRALDQALELAEPDARIEYNAGAGHLAAGTPGAALPLLQRAADRPAGLEREAWRSLRPDALYNLGNAYLDSGEPQAAADAYRACLRLAPEHQPAKHNLELALRRAAAGSRAPQSGPGGSGGDGRPQPEAESEGKEGDSGDQPEPAESGGTSPGAEGEPGAGGGAEDQAEGPRQGGARSPRLPAFAPQRDMSAEQAAALLEAVENLEREQRRAQAEEQQRQRARRATERDW